MNLNTLLNEMFPGDVASGIPSFAQLSEFHSTTFCLQSHKGLIEALAAIPVGTDVNLVLKKLKSDNFDATQSFIQKALEVYFTHPDVLGALRDGKITLYPHVRVLNDIDYDLLEPVMTKNLGAIRV